MIDSAGEELIRKAEDVNLHQRVTLGDFGERFVDIQCLDIAGNAHDETRQLAFVDRHVADRTATSSTDAVLPPRS